MTLKDADTGEFQTEMEDARTIIARILAESGSGNEALERIENEIEADQPVLDLFMLQLGIALTRKFRAQIMNQITQRGMS